MSLDMIKKDKEIPFLIALSFLASFVFIRLSVFIAGAAETEFAQAAKAGDLPAVDFYIGTNIILFGYHIHHFYIGIALLAVAGWFALVGSNILSIKHLAVIYGAGLGLFFDEIGLLLTWGDYYSHLSYLLSIFVAAIFLNIIFFHDFWVSVRDNLVKSKPHSLFWLIFLKHDSFLRTADILSEQTGRTEKTSLLFTGVLYLLISGLILQHPQAVRYWVSVAFIIQGVDYLIKFFRNERGEDVR